MYLLFVLTLHNYFQMLIMCTTKWRMRTCREEGAPAGVFREFTCAIQSDSLSAEHIG